MTPSFLSTAIVFKTPRHEERTLAPFVTPLACLCDSPLTHTTQVSPRYLVQQLAFTSIMRHPQVSIDIIRAQYFYDTYPLTITIYPTPHLDPQHDEVLESLGKVNVLNVRLNTNLEAGYTQASRHRLVLNPLAPEEPQYITLNLGADHSQAYTDCTYKQKLTGVSRYLVYLALMMPLQRVYSSDFPKPNEDHTSILSIFSPYRHEADNPTIGSI